MTHQPAPPPPHEEPASPAGTPPVPLGRVLAMACLVPILGVLMLGASRFDAIRAVSVGGEVHALADDQPQEPDQVLYNLSQATENALASEMQGLEPAVVGSGERMYRVIRIEMMEVTAYCACTKCCGKNAQGITASGKPVSYNGGRFVAADTRLLPFGTKLRVPMYHDGAVVEVIDRGGLIKGNKLDVYFDDHEVARRWGRQILPVEILVEMDSSPAP